jgi:hypothetical protein
MIKNRRVIVTLELDTSAKLEHLNDHNWWKRALGAAIANPVHSATAVEAKALRVAKKNAVASKTIRDAKPVRLPSDVVK